MAEYTAHLYKRGGEKLCELPVKIAGDISMMSVYSADFNRTRTFSAKTDTSALKKAKALVEESGIPGIILQSLTKSSIIWSSGRKRPLFRKS